MKLNWVIPEVKENLNKGSWIRKLFDEGARLKKEFGENKVFDFSLGNPIVEPPEAFKRALIAEAEKRQPRIHTKPRSSGSERKVAQFLGSRFEADFSAERIVMTVGAGGALNVALKSIINAGRSHYSRTLFCRI